MWGLVPELTIHQQALSEVAKHGIEHQRVRVPGHEQRAGPLGSVGKLQERDLSDVRINVAVPLEGERHRIAARAVMMAKREARQCDQSHPSYEGCFNFGSHGQRVLFPSDVQSRRQKATRPFP